MPTKKKKMLIIVCKKCRLAECGCCYCEKDILQLRKDEADTLKEGYIPVDVKRNGDIRWIKKKPNTIGILAYID